MSLDDLPLELDPVEGAVQAWHGDVDGETWRLAHEQARSLEGRLIALWGSDRVLATESGGRLAIHSVLAVQSSLIWMTHCPTDGSYASLADLYPAANRMQRAAFDMIGIRADGSRDTRPWLRQGAWPDDRFPLRKDFDPHSLFDNRPDEYPFVRVEGDGVHEIPVGPVHAGTIEPGHFRFSILGERVLRLEERLGYKHKGIEKRFEQMTLADGARLAGRVSGDSTVAYAWAYAMAVEGATGCAVPARATWLRALFLERERLANHLGDLGFLGNDAGFAFGLAQFSRLKEDVLRLNRELFGHRYLMDAIVPGGVAVNAAGQFNEVAMSRIVQQCEALAPEIDLMHRVYDDHSGVQDRFNTTGTVSPELAAKLGLTGQGGRASGQAFDARVHHPCAPYPDLSPRLVVHHRGDVAARVRQRFDEAHESMRLTLAILTRLREASDPFPIVVPLPAVVDGAKGLGFIEGWRGPVLVALETAAGNRIDRLHAHDPSWQNWPLLEHAVIGNIVPDFPLINKSFNLSYSGQDL